MDVVFYCWIVKNRYYKLVHIWGRVQVQGGLRHCIITLAMLSRSCGGVGGRGQDSLPGDLRWC